MSHSHNLIDSSKLDDIKETERPTNEQSHLNSFTK